MLAVGLDRLRHRAHSRAGGLQESELEPPAALHDGVMRAIRQEQRKPRRAWLPAAAIAAAAALVLLFCVLGFDLLFEPGPLRELSFGTPLGREYRFPLPLD